MIHTIVQLPLEDRYTADWFRRLRDDPDFHVMGQYLFQTVDRTKPYNYFSNLEEATQYESFQIFNLVYEENVERILITDLDFPGLAVAAIPLLKLKFPDVKIYGVFHAGSWCNKDLFEGDNTKILLEAAAFEGCEKVFVASQYHKDKIEDYFSELILRIVVLGGMPFYAEDVQEFRRDKTKDVLVLGRQEQSMDLTTQSWNTMPDFHQELISRDDYLAKLARYKIAVFPKAEETFGYSALEAVAVGTIPLVPDDYSYPEFIPREFRFSSFYDIPIMVDNLFNIPAALLQAQEVLEAIDLTVYSDIIERMKVEMSK